MAAGGEAWATDRAFTVDLKGAVGALAEVTFKGDIAAQDGAQPVIKGAYAVASASPADAMEWAVGAATPQVVSLTDLALAGEIDLNDAGGAIVADGGLVRDGRLATVGLKVAGGPDWATAMAFDVDAKVNFDGLAAASYIGRVAALPAGALSLDGVYSLTADAPANAIAWATGAPADPRVVDLTNVAVNGGVALSDAGLYATVKGRAATIGQPASFDLAAKSDAGWETSRAFAVNLTAEGQGLGAVKFTGDVQAPDGAAPSVAGAFDVSATDLRAIAKLTGAVLPSNHPDAFRTLSATGSVSPPDANRLNVSLKKLAFARSPRPATSRSVMANRWRSTPT